MTDPAMSFPTENGRYYRHPTQRASVPSITNILKQENKPAINGSNVRKAAEYAVDNRDKLAPLSRDEQIRLIKGTQWARNPAAHIGDIVHAWVDRYIKTGQDATDEEPIELNNGKEQIYYKDAPLTARRMWRQFIGFIERHNPTFLNAEFTVWSYQYGYAGTADWAAVVHDWLVLADTKTGSGVWPEVGKQLAALSHADVLITAQGAETTLPSYDQCAVLHLRPTYHEFIQINKDTLESCFKAFLGLKANFDHYVSYEDKVLLHAPKVYSDYKGA